MFLDPDPKGRDSRVSSPSSPFFASHSPIPSPRLQGEQSWRIKRSPLQDASPTFKNHWDRRSTSTGEDAKSTVRLVHSPVFPTPNSSDNALHLSGKQDWTTLNNAPPHTSLRTSSQPASGPETGSPAASRVSDVQSMIARAQQMDLPPIVTLLPSTYSKLAPEPSRNRRSTSSKYSGSGTSNSTDALDSLFYGSESSRTGRLSGRSTLYEEEIPDTGDEKIGSGTVHHKASALETVRETSPEHPERATAPSVSSGSQGQSIDTTRGLQSLPLDSSPTGSLSWAEETQLSLEDSLGSLPASSLSLPRSLPQPLTGQDSQETLAYDREDYTSSSPNFIAYSDSTSPHSPDSPLHNASSLDSIQARLGTSPAFRPTTSGTTGPNNSPTHSLPKHHYRSLSADTVSPLQSPTRREQDQTRTRSSSMNASDNMDYEEIDLEPWPRNQFSSHLSTIASESDRAMSPAQFSHLSHFSMGSGVLTIDDAYSIPMSATRSRGSGNLSSFSMSRRASEPLQSPSNKSSLQQTQHSDEEVGDMTLDVYRAESAKPEPLFLGRQVTSGGDVRYDGPLPPLPPMPRSRSGNADETSDRLSALSAPSLKKKRSGYSVRGRSNSTPSGSQSRSNSVASYCDSDRGSKGSVIFPIWAKNFYGGYAALLSASKISLHNPPTPRREHAQPLGHIRNMSQRTQHSITSRLGTGYSELENVSPTSSHFLPSIFRPRTRTLGASDSDSRSFGFGNKAGKRKVSQSRADETSRPDSLAITSDPDIPVEQVDESSDTLPSGHPRFGPLKDNSSNQPPPMPPLPRKYSKQKLWDEMTFPRPMTKDRLSDFNLNAEEDSPHLRPNKNQEPQVNKWRSPSFVESFDTLFNSRGNRQILLFALGFLFPFFWLLGALLPLPPRRTREASEAEKALPTADSEDDLTSHLNKKHRSGDARIKWDEERLYLKAKWWRTLNRVMCFVGVAIIAAVVSTSQIANAKPLLTSLPDRPCCHRNPLITAKQLHTTSPRNWPHRQTTACYSQLLQRSRPPNRQSFVNHFLEIIISATSESISTMYRRISLHLLFSFLHNDDTHGFFSTRR
jgi:hypothetical protein